MVDIVIADVTENFIREIGRGGANDEDPLWLEIFHTAPHVDRVADEDDEDRDDSCGETAPMKPQKNLPAAKGRAGRRYLKRCVYAFGIPGLMTGVLLVFQLVESIPESFLTYPINPDRRCWKNLPAAKGRAGRRYLKRCVYAFGIPGLMTGVLLVFQLVESIPESFLTYPINPDRRCWFRSDWTILAYFYGPLALVLGANFVFFVLTSYFLIAHRKNTKNLNMRESQKKKFWLFVKLFLVMGVGWTMEVISWKAGSVASFYVTDAVNSLTGIFVFIVFILRRKTLKDLRERFCSKRRASTPGSSETRTTTASSSSSSNKHGANLRSVFATKKSYSPRRDLTNSALPYIDDDQEKLSGNVEKISIKPVGD
ncbi:unnamed protein product [Notodromas monacha]|uniref:G-protein coupled receptors family 2 profile 2 domain-containing protein n=1 Tax=Notodromas monacha TaxID=399045 RepID=A0A7R9G863_9CRUS|nr:unnamed protein product [Notodromas monacha]CAG0912801.1 unnamed protein product [Notodromas monacha]